MLALWIRETDWNLFPLYT